jgi:carbonic anhydrase
MSLREEAWEVTDSLAGDSSEGGKRAQRRRVILLHYRPGIFTGELRMRPFGPTRREFVTASGLLTSGLVMTAGRALSGALAADISSTPRPEEILQKLLAGNQRFVKGKTTNPRRKPEDFGKLVEGQTPKAVIVGCADSRVPPELLFDQGVGDLFVVRVAGNVVSGAGAIVKGSIEYAVAELNVPLVMVLGHTQCGAVKAAMKHISDKDPLPGAIAELVNAIKPAVINAKDRDGNALDNAIKANVAIGVERLKSLEPIVAIALREGRVKVVGGVYDLRTGSVTMIT